ncbi:MAG: hypothetical protein LC793_15685 [Thermomicrobia bacterium]|nr:hypothetical protein [Thermomicrobia bacterium]MCA1722820.1 hypothetical protein [Thermomicrobia bacterium]
MVTKRRRIIARLAMGCLFLAIVALLPVTLPTPETNVPAAQDPRDVGPIFTTVTATQQFPADRRDIRAISLFFSTFQRANPGGVVVTVASLNSGQWTTLNKQAVEKTTLHDGSYATFLFSPPLSVAPHQLVRIIVQADGDQTSAITWEVNPHWRPDGYALRVDGNELQGSARFHVQYAGQTGRVWQRIVPVWHRLTVFLDPFWQIVFFVGIAIIIGGLALFTGPPDD